MQNDLSDPRLDLSEEMNRALKGVDASDPAQRTAAALYVVLKSQLDQLGQAPGTVPFDARFGSVEARGALLGTAISVVRGHRSAPEQEHYFDAIVAAFTIVFGSQVGPAKARETIEQSGNGNAALNAAAERASVDTVATFSDDSPTMPSAFHRAVTGAR